MQDAHVGAWLRGEHVSAEMQGSVRELNHRFLDLVVAQVEWDLRGKPLIDAVSARVAPLSATQKAAAANCPYALFDLRFHDANHWRRRLKAVARGGVAEAPAVDGGTLEFVRLALFFAWHLAGTAGLAAQLLLGMHESTVAVFREATIDCVPWLAESEAANLTARWNDCPAFWSALTGAASRSNPANLRRIQLSGLQLAAAAHLCQDSSGRESGSWERSLELRGVPREV